MTAQVLALHPPSMSMSLHYFNDLATAPFDTAAYSRMKFGSDQSAKRFGYDLAQEFIQQYGKLLVEERCIVIPSPSTIVPVAATMLSLHFMNALNDHLTRTGAPAVEWTHIHRNISYNLDFHHLDSKTRRDVLDQDQLYLNHDYVDGKCLLFIDDVRITGAHEEKLAKYLIVNRYRNPHVYIAFANYTGNDPTIEARLNHVDIKDGLDVIALAAREHDHKMTTRAIRLILELPRDKMVIAVERMPYVLAEDAYFAAINKSYHEVEEYRENFAMLAERIRR